LAAVGFYVYSEHKRRGADAAVRKTDAEKAEAARVAQVRYETLRHVAEVVEDLPAEARLAFKDLFGKRAEPEEEAEFKAIKHADRLPSERWRRT
jgi:hypothetical protein